MTFDVHSIPPNFIVKNSKFIVFSCELAKFEERVEISNSEDEIKELKVQRDNEYKKIVRMVCKILGGKCEQHQSVS